MRFALFFALSLFLHVMIALLFSTCLNHPLREHPSKEPPLAISLQAIHILPPPSLPGEPETIFEDKKLKSVVEKMIPKAPNPVLKERAMQPQKNTLEKPVISEMPPIHKPLHTMHHIKNSETIFDKIQEVIVQPQTNTPENSVISEIPSTQEPLHAMSHIKNSETIFNEIQKVIVRYKQYPKRAQREGMEGEVTVSFTWSLQGLHALKVIKSSKHKVLNEYSLELVQTASKEFPSVNEAIDIVLPIGFTLH